MQVAVVRLPYDYVSNDEPVVLPVGFNDAYVSSALAWLGSEGYAPEVFDFFLKQDLDPEPLIRSGYALILVSRGYPSQQLQVRRFLSKLKLECEPDTIVATFGLGVSATAESTLRSGLADVVVLGEEPEPSILQLAEAVEGGHDLAKVEGIARILNGNVSMQRPIPYVEDLDAAPDPVLYHLVQERYRSGSLTQGAALLTSRGCYANCAFCHVSYSRRLDSKYRWRAMSPGATVELLRKVSRMGVRYFGIQDLDFFGPKPDRAIQIADGILSQGLDIRLQIYTRADAILRNVSHLKRLHGAGIHRITIGGESFIRSKLAQLNKGYRPEVLDNAIAQLRDLDFDIQLGFIPFTPDVGLEDIEGELRHLLEILANKPHLFKESFAYVSNFLQFYDSSPLKSRYLQLASRTVSSGFEQVYLALVRKQSDPSQGPMPWFRDQRVALVGLVCLLIAAEASGKVNEIAHHLAARITALRANPTPAGEAWLTGVVAWELGISTFLINLTLDICQRVSDQFPARKHESDEMFRELLGYAFNRLVEFYGENLPDGMAELRTRESVCRFVDLVMPA